MKPKEPNPISMKYNLFQNFYIIGYSLSDFFSLKTKNIFKFSDIFNTNKLIPKIIRKFPNLIKNYNSITDDLIISHCFPKGIKFGFDRPEFGEIVILCQSLRWVCRDSSQLP